MDATNTPQLAGKFFHSFSADGKILEWQGVVISQETPEFFLVQLFDWIVGKPSALQLVSIGDMTTWQFYQSAVDMRNAYRRHHGESDHEEADDRATDSSAKRERLTPARRFRLFQRDNWRCQLCGRTAADGYSLEIDHRIPVAKGGSNEDANLWVLCETCNRGKSAELIVL